MKKVIKRKSKIFCDSADIKIIKKYSKNSLVCGFTTNPSLMRLSGAKNYKRYSKKILKICNNKPISFEVFADNEKEMEIQAHKINSWGKNIYVKIPVTNSKGRFTGKLIKKLNSEGLKLNITAVYTLNQVKKISRCLNKKTDTIISIFSGRMADAGKDPVPIIQSSVKYTKRNKKIKILWASTREAYNYTQASKYGCEIITTPPAIIDKILKFGKSFENLTKDTVKTFYSDAAKSKFNI